MEKFIHCESTKMTQMRAINISLMKYGAVLILAILFIFGCKRTFLDKAPYDQISNDNFWNTEDDA